jgi:hypothetical protein
MTTRRWIAQTLLLTALVGGGLVLVNVALDMYGIFRDARGRHLSLYDSERRGKYLLNERYVPQNFEAVLLGSSVTSNWNTGAMTACRTYNESTDGGNITEERLLVEQYLKSRTPKLAIFVVHPYLTDSHGQSADEMKPSEHWSALGSTTLFSAYKNWLTAVRHHEAADWDDVGTEVGQSPDGVKPLNPVLRRIMTSDGEVEIDPVALEEYRGLVAALRARGVRIAAVVPPTTAPLLEPHRARLDNYVRKMLATFAAEDRVIDLNGPGFAAFRADPTNYRDGVHLTRRGARQVVAEIDRRLLGAPRGRTDEPAAALER